MKALFISDVHLQDANGKKTRAVLEFLQSKASQVDHLFILGDLFDVWPGTTNYLISYFSPVLDVFRSLINQGCSIHYIEGNHDFRLGKYFTERVGIKVYPYSFEAVWNNRKVFIAHGDLGNPSEKSYRILRKLLRSDWLHFLIKPIPGKLIFLLGQKTSQASRNYQKTSDSKIEQIRKTYRDTAKDLFEKGYDVVVMGHTHVPDEFNHQVSDRLCCYYNTGDWVKNFTYLEFDDGEFYTRKHPLTEF
ncbi:MAG: UDP-2,3-diacylglucosamine diphosphatase [Deltaproteobacteria bacterium]|jgi:UDP-2,3-diacylglucosamine hydrolase